MHMIVQTHAHHNLSPELIHILQPRVKHIRPFHFTWNPTNRPLHRSGAVLWSKIYFHLLQDKPGTIILLKIPENYWKVLKS